ncbi:MAG: rhodanese-like domain-containing protein [Sulfurospirillaceae bacterium]|nr:rhodanese-like domain-containing protein [Sulfurospirillaceae bacterium]
MKKWFVILTFFTTFLFGDVRNVKVSEEFIKSGVKIIDIRTEPEWEQTGIVKDSILITFFDAQGGYNEKEFLSKLDKYVSKDKEFALICRTGNRTTAVSEILGKSGYKVINLKGGVKKLMEQGVVLEPLK